MDMFNRMLSEPLIISCQRDRKMIKPLDAKTLAVISAAESEDGETINTTITLEKGIMMFDCVVIKDNSVFLVIVDENNYLQGYHLWEDKAVKAFGPVSLPGRINSLALAAGSEREIHLFFATTKLGMSSLLQYKFDGKMLEFMAELEKGKGGFFALNCVSDFWGGINLFYLTVVKGVAVIKHKYYLLLNKRWSPSYTITANNYNTRCYSVTRDKKNNFYVALIQEREEEVLCCLKREAGGWPEGGWQREQEIGRGNFLGVPVIEYGEDRRLTLLVREGEEARIYTWTDGYYNSISTETLPWKTASLSRHRTLLGNESEYISLEFVKKGLFRQEKEKDVLEAQEENVVYVTEKREQQDSNRSDEVFLKKAFQIMQVKNELEDNLKRKEKSFARISKQYEEQIAVLQEQLAAQAAKNKSIESKLNKQEANALTYTAELKKKESELADYKKEAEEIKGTVKEREKEIQALKTALAGKESDILFLMKQMEEKTGNKGIWRKLGKLFQDK